MISSAVLLRFNRRSWQDLSNLRLTVYPMSESPQLVRQWKLLRLFEASRTGYTVQELVREAEMSDKTIRRDIKVLQTVFPIDEIVGERGLKRFRMKPLAEQVGFTVTDLLSIHMSRQFLEPLAGSPFFDGQQNVQRKVKGVLGEQAVRYIEKISDKLRATAVGAGDYRKRGEMIDRLTMAIEDRKIALIVYQSMQATEPVEQEVYPLGMVYHRNSLYLIAWSSRRKEVRTYKVDRIDEAELQNLQYQVPQGFSLDDWLEKSFGVYRSGNEELQTIRVQFSRDVARYVAESNWHPSQTLEPQSDGSLIAEFQLPDTSEIKRWIMSFGVGAKVLEPQSLADEICKNFQTVVSSYEPQTGESL